MKKLPRSRIFRAALVSVVVSTAFLGALAEGVAQTRQAPAPAPSGSASSGPVADAARVGDAFASVAERVSPTVVTLEVEAVRQRGRRGQSPFGSRGGDSEIANGSGSGVIIRANGYVLTNNHVVENARRIVVVLRDGRRLPGQVVGVDRATDLAVVRVQATGLPVASWGSSDRARVGQWVVAIGAPFGLDYSVTAGVLSAIGRGIGANEIEDYLQTDASINPGNSGGPLVNLTGEILGINTMIIGRGTGIGFAIPSDMARMVADQLITGGVVRRAYLGVGFQELTPELAGHFGARNGRGALINRVEPNGPAARAGVRDGDIITAVDGNPVVAGRDLMRHVIRRPVGAQVQLTVLRVGRRRTITVTTVERPRSGEARPQPASSARRSRGHGALLTPLNDQIRHRLGYRGQGSVVISRVESGSPADHAGLRTGDVILRADHKTVTSPNTVNEALADDGEALLRIERRGRTFFAALTRN